MKYTMPQEVEVWYLIPSLRRELAKMFISVHGLSQKETAGILGITESAISQYLNSKRAKEMRFSAKDITIIKKAAADIVKDRGNIREHLYRLCLQFKGSKALCDVHQEHDPTVPKDCNLCANYH
ncbi:TPA: transcriptional regulator [Candidatus Woesearchaeota archaeon]|nr:transcriptional regulator [Candidatus Woesearchaeota archaeon]HII68597.1 transcriptional regulator [Candidatus Woesearchaeota archaeon]